MKDKHKKRKQEVRDELSSLSPFLNKMKDEETPFKVPDQYFQQLPDQIIDRLKSEGAWEEEPSSSWSFNEFFQKLADRLAVLLQPRMAMALASVLVIVVVAWFLMRQNQSSSNGALDFAVLSAEEIQFYIEANMDDFDEETVMQVAQDDSDIKLIPPTGIDSEELDRLLDQVIDDMDTQELEELF